MPAFRKPRGTAASQPRSDGKGDLGLTRQPPFPTPRGHPSPSACPPARPTSPQGCLHPSSYLSTPPRLPPPQDREAGGRGVVSRGGVRRLPSPRGPSCWGPRGGSRARSWKLARLRLPRASQGRSPRPAEGATLQPRQGVESPAGLPGTGRAPERPASRGGDLVAIEAPHPRADFQLPGVDPKKIIQTQKERCVRIYSQRRKEMVPKNLGTSAQWNFFFPSGVH